MPRRRSQDTIDRDARAADMRRRNMSFRQIARELGFASTRSAYEAARRGLADSLREPIEEARRLALERLDDMSRVAWTILSQDHFVVTTTGRIVEHPETGNPLHDAGPVLGALDRLSKFEEARRKLLGLDAPIKTFTMDAIDAAIDSLNAEAAELDRLEAAEATPPEATSS